MGPAQHRRVRHVGEAASYHADRVFCVLWLPISDVMGAPIGQADVWERVGVGGRALSGHGRTYWNIAPREIPLFIGK